VEWTQVYLWRQPGEINRHITLIPQFPDPDSTKPETLTVRPQQLRDIAATPSRGDGSVAASPQCASSVQPSTQRRTRCVPPCCSTRPLSTLVYTATSPLLHYNSILQGSTHSFIRSISRRFEGDAIAPRARRRGDPGTRPPPCHKNSRNNSVCVVAALETRRTSRAGGPLVCVCAAASRAPAAIHG
jgi:hypothetical protein